MIRRLDHLRIRLHLLGAELALRAKPTVPAAAIADLRRYRRAGIFPSAQRDRLEPVFHDPAGPVCAVASLMHASGAGALADTVAARENLALVADMTTPGLLAWAEARGLTARDLQRIQPRYLRAPTPAELAYLTTLALLTVACFGVCFQAARLGLRALRDRTPGARALRLWLLGVLPLPALAVGYALIFTAGGMTQPVPDTFLEGGAVVTGLAALVLWPLTALLLVGLGIRRLRQ